MATQYELYSLNATSDIVLSPGANKVNLSLMPGIAPSLQLLGKVYELNTNIPIASCSVILRLNTNYYMTETDKNGFFSIIIPYAKIYSLEVKKYGYSSYTSSVTITKDTIEYINIALTKSSKFGIVYGKVFSNLLNSNVLSDATINIINNNKIVQVANSIYDGEYAVYNLQAGDYTIVGFLDGYISDVKTFTVTNTTEAININLVLVQAFTGYISGRITDSNGNNLSNVWVGLYQIIDSNEVLIESTFTNTNLTGNNYQFRYIQDGSYVVKSEQRGQEID